MTDSDKPENFKRESGAFQKLDEGDLMRTLIDLIPDIISVKDVEGKNVWVNHAKLNELGLRDFKDAIGKSSFDFFDPATAEGFERDSDQVIQAGQPVIDRHEKIVQRDGSTRWHLTTKIPWRDSGGKIIGLFSISRDITKRVEIEIKLEQERNLLRTLIDNLPDCIYAKDAQTRKIMANPADLRNLGCKTEAEAIGKTDFDLFPKEIAEAFFADDQSVLKGQSVINREEKAVLKTGETHWLLTSKIPWRDANGSIIGLIGIGRDVTDKKNLEAQIAQAQRMESIGRLAVGVAHDLNNTLAPILMSIDLLRQKIHDDEGLKIMAAIEGSAKRGADIIKEMLLWFGRGLIGERAPVNLRQLASEIAQSAETFDKAIKVEKQIAPDLWPVIGNPAQLHQVLMNLVTNARDAMPSGGTLTINAFNTGTGKERFVIVEVKDTGAGMTPELLDRIFEPFFTTKDVGHGLGLSTAQSIVKSHGGVIETESQPGQGSTFRVRLPAQA
ncbi:MAG TPA: PAS domain-containing protein [Methylomirabilota bacterium]|nr:PAS domain-containing protein [Methylomirabilota bacterium]